MPRIYSKRLSVGDNYHLLCGSIATVIKYNNSRSVEIVTTTGYNCVVKADNLIKGVVKDRLFKSFNGKGFLGIGNYDSKSLCFTFWGSMIKRSHSENYKKIHPAYLDISCCEEWHNLQIFGKWFDENYTKGYHLDKDLKVYGNKIYSPETCTFVPREINNFFYSKGKKIMGVAQYNNKYSAKIKYKLRNTYDEALEDYWIEKYNKLKKLVLIYPEFDLLMKNYFDKFRNEQGR